MPVRIKDWEFLYYLRTSYLLKKHCIAWGENLSKMCKEIAACL